MQFGFRFPAMGTLDVEHEIDQGLTLGEVQFLAESITGYFNPFGRDVHQFGNLLAAQIQAQVGAQM